MIDKLFYQGLKRNDFKDYVQVGQNLQRPDINCLLGYTLCLKWLVKVTYLLATAWFRAYTSLIPLIVGHSHRNCLSSMPFLTTALFTVFSTSVLCDCRSVARVSCRILINHTWLYFMYYISMYIYRQSIVTIFPFQLFVSVSFITLLYHITQK